MTPATNPGQSLLCDCHSSDLTSFLCGGSRYKEQWGDCLVPRRFWEDWRLGEWVADARQAHKEKRLTPAQVATLEGLGFPWKVPQVRLCSPCVPLIAHTAAESSQASADADSWPVFHVLYVRKTRASHAQCMRAALPEVTAAHETALCWAPSLPSCV